MRIGWLNYFYYLFSSPHIPHESDDLDTKKMVLELLNAGAHTDYVNKNGECPHTGYLTSKILLLICLIFFTI